MVGKDRRWSPGLAWAVPRRCRHSDGGSSSAVGCRWTSVSGSGRTRWSTTRSPLAAGIVLVGLLVVLNAVFAGSEIALISLREGQWW